MIEERLLALVRDFYDLFHWLGGVVMMALESAGIPIPSEMIMPLAGWMLVRDKGLGLDFLLLAGLLGAIGNVLGSVLAYWIGMKGGRPFLRRYGKYLLISQKDLAWAEAWFGRYGNQTVFFSRLMPVVRTYISFPAGLSGMGFPRFVLYTLAGSFPWSLGLAWGGYLLGENWEGIRAAMRPFDIPILAVFLALVGLWLYRHLRHKKAA